MYKNVFVPVKHEYHYYSLAVLVILSFCWQSSLARVHVNFGNPNIPCLGRNMFKEQQVCKYGSYILNYDPINCPDITVCYRGVGENCDRDNKCGDNAICTYCGKCRKCDGPDNCSGFELCPDKERWRYFNSLMQKRLMKFTEADV